MIPALREYKRHKSDNECALEKIRVFAPCQIVRFTGEFACDLTSGTVLKDGKDFTEEVEPVMALERNRREGRQTGDSMSEGIAMGMKMDFYGENEWVA